jgi:uncharacterized protein YajQ (UPF0234 family)
MAATPIPFSEGFLRMVDHGAFVSRKDRGSLQEVIAPLKQTDLGIDMQFTNLRSN